MAPKSNVHAVLANFRSGMVKATQVLADATKEREEKLKKVQGGGRCLGVRECELSRSILCGSLRNFTCAWLNSPSLAFF